MSNRLGTTLIIKRHMKTPTHSMVSARAAIVALLVSVAASTGMAQTPKTASGKMPQHQDGMKGMKDMRDMRGMMGGPHQVLAMAYRDNLVTFARALRGQVNETKSVRLDFARPAVSEMRRSFDQMKEHHQAQMKVMADRSDPPTSRMMQQMDTHLSALGEHLTALESEIGASTPDYKKVSEHSTVILKQCAEMSAMHGTSKPHKMKS